MTQKEATDSLALLSQELNVRGNLGECGERVVCPLDYLPTHPSLPSLFSLRPHIAHAYPKHTTEIKSCLSEVNKDLHNCNLQIKGMLQNGIEIYANVNIVR
jgi:hypothetical protein